MRRETGASRGPVAAIGVALLALALAGGTGCRGGDPAARYLRLRADVDSMLVTDRLEDLEPLLDSVASRPVSDATPEWLRDWARRRAASVRVMRALPPEHRAELAATARPVPAAVEEDPLGWSWMRPALQRRLEARRRLLGPDSPDVAETLTALGRLERFNGGTAEALAGDLEALAIRRRCFGPLSPEVADAQWMIGSDYRLSSSYVPARSYLDSALALTERLQGKESLAYADVLMDRANIDRLFDGPIPAFGKFAHALAIRRRLLGSRSAPVAETLTDLAVAHLHRGDWRTIERLTGEAVEIQDALRSGPTTGHALSLNMRGLALRHLGRLGEAEAVLERTIAVQEARRRGAPDDDVARRRFHRLAAWADLAVVQLLAGDSLAAFESLERGLSRRWLERAWARDEVDSAACWDRLLERVQARLSDSTAMVGWLDPIFNPGSPGNPFWGYVVRRTGGVRWYPMEAAPGDPRRSFRSSTFTFASKLDAAADWPFEIERWDDLEAVQRDLWSMRFAAMEPSLEGVRELVVVSPQINYMCPVELMMDDRGHYLGDRFAITYAPSALHFLSSPEPRREDRTRGLWGGLILRAPGVGTDDREISELAARLRRPRVLVGAAASERAVRDLAQDGSLRDLDLVHIAAHGRYTLGWSQSTWIELAESAREHPPTGHDGLLGVEDLESWELRARLLTLATCRGSGSHSHSQGTAGIGQSFLHAGARSVVMSVAAVEDEAAARFMRYFYDALFARDEAPCSIAEALRRARLRMRVHQDAAGGRPYAHPMYWGAFVLLGDSG